VSLVHRNVKSSDARLEASAPDGEASDIVGVDMHGYRLPCFALPQETRHSPHTVSTVTTVL